MRVEARVEAGLDSITIRCLLPSLFDMRNKISVVAVTSFLVACATYTPMPQTSPTANQTVRLTLTDAAQTESFGKLGTRVRTLEGEIRSVDDSSVTVAVNELGRTSSDNERVQGELVTIPRRDISAMDLRRVDVLRSVAIAGALAGSLIWIGSQGHGDVGLGKPKIPGPQQ
jgi:hypothetical protein